MNISSSNINLKNPIHFLAFGFGSGLSPKAPGTMGTLVAIPLFWLISLFSNNSAYLMISILFIVAGIYICGRTADDLGVHDHPGIVWDEIAGYMVTMFLLPAEPLWMVGGFILFRFFDILKPFPISWLDKNLKGGTGIMLDDILAGMISCAILHLLNTYI